MMYSEFEKLTGLTEKAIDNDMYHAIENIYMSCEDDKITFCKSFYSLYSKTVAKAVEKCIKSASLEEKINMIEHIDNNLSDRADKIMREKTWQLIRLLEVA